VSALLRWLALWSLGLGVYVGGWYIEGPAFQAVQMGSVALFIGAGFLALLAGGTRRVALCPSELILGSAFMFAMLVAFLRGVPMSTVFGTMFLVVLASVSVLARQPWVDSVNAVFRRAYVALIASILLVQPGEFLTSAAGTVEYSIGLVRFAPLGMHPNLSGLVYGGGALLFGQHFLSSQRTHQKLFALLMAGLCMSVVLAASARASLLALGLTGALGVVLIAWRGSRRARMVLLLGALALVGVAVWKAGAIADYLQVILDLDSPTRGTDSGATGREEIWADGIRLFLSDPLLFFTGRGVRAAGPEVIGFPVESSYINLALEHGAVFGLLMVLCFVTTAWRTLGRSFQHGVMNPALLLSGLMLVFVLLQSVFNRYLIAVGNPYSLWILLLLLRLNLAAPLARVAAVKPRAAAPRPQPTPSPLSTATGRRRPAQA
jgi:exopolysaccharide production protein ExoQ